MKQYNAIDEGSAPKHVTAFMVIYSLVAAFIVSTDTPVSHNTSVILAPLENIVLYFVVLLSLFYNYYFLSYVYPVQRLFPIFDASCVMVIAMGYIQLGALLGYKHYDRAQGHDR